MQRYLKASKRFVSFLYFHVTIFTGSLYDFYPRLHHSRSIISSCGPRQLSSLLGAAHKLQRPECPSKRFKRYNGAGLFEEMVRFLILFTYRGVVIELKSTLPQLYSIHSDTNYTLKLRKHTQNRRSINRNLVFLVHYSPNQTKSHPITFTLLMRAPADTLSSRSRSRSRHAPHRPSCANPTLYLDRYSFLSAIHTIVSSSTEDERQDNLRTIPGPIMKETANFERKTDMLLAVAMLFRTKEEPPRSEDKDPCRPEGRA
ncbi:hypothetical protein BD410DRAFT_844851 [Rickenella mellea]|uniref:Uncharacterized protein n=1 Tax=Rickenella mellea TaxID=50990 RepID=A0A4Y7PMP2_9AGAM|nr:hypothetical protein BD410DRAFT_844851 [Rickenella mellea]